MEKHPCLPVTGNRLINSRAKLMIALAFTEFQ
jgi:hypothetical protein